MPKLNDQTSFPHTPPAPGPEPMTVLRNHDWAAIVAAAEKETNTYVPDYEFSGRTFYRIDRLLNPR